MPDTLSMHNLRQTIRQQRQQLDKHTQITAAKRLAQHVIDAGLIHEGAAISAYLPIKGEISPQLILNHALSKACSLYMPVMQSDYTLLFAPYTANSPLLVTQLGLSEPDAPADSLITAGELDIVLAPLVAFDEHGNRLGMGAGYYDRTLSIRKTQSTPITIGLAYEFQKQPLIPSNDWDIPMDIIATENQLYQPDKHREK